GGVPASLDVRILSGVGKTPAIIDGPGSLLDAHAVDESLSIEAYLRAIEFTACLNEVDGVSPARTAGKAAAGKAPRRIAIIGNLEVDLVLGPLPRLPQWGEERIVARRERRAAGSAGYT